MLRYILDVVRQARILVKDRQSQEHESKIKAHIAQVFNNRYTYQHRYYTNSVNDKLGTYGDYAWMCPNCNKIHNPVEVSAFSGLQYPACCTYPLGHRLDEKINKG